MDDSQVKKAAELLLKGAKMLGIACPECNEPLYQLKDKAMKCVSCDKPVVFEDKAPDKIIPHTPSVTSDPIQLKIDQLGQDLLSENDPEKILEIAELIKKLKNLLG